ncbi:MAG: hypothetical protein IPK68_00205 [Bdellovibrionales bacterium]|nr:hypothetical protein [Bdellovibrionales bacterium]
MNRNADTFPGGFPSSGDSFINYIRSGANSSYFSWGSKVSGSGASEFGLMLSESGAYPHCLARRVFRSVCKRDPVSFEEDMLKNAARSFTEANYSLRELFKRIAISRECLGQ